MNELVIKDIKGQIESLKNKMIEDQKDYVKRFKKIEETMRLLE